MAILGAALMLGAVGLQAKTFRWTSASDIGSWDIHAQNTAMGNNLHMAVYESLVAYNSRTYKVEPVLATAWTQISPTQLRLSLRQGVKFQDGSAFTADDAVFSLQRAMAKTSNYGVLAQGIDRVVKVDDRSIDIFTRDPNPVLLSQLTDLRMMSKAWAEANHSVDPKDIKTKDENFAHRHAMGTGPFMLKEWQPGQRTVMVRHPGWWGRSEGNVTEVVFTPIRNPSARAEALLSGEVDFVLDPSPQDLPRLRQDSRLRVIDGIENRTMFLGMDQKRDELVGSNVKGRNPLKDVRVRKALYQAIDISSLTRITLGGLGQPTGALVAPQVNGWTEALHKRYPYDVAAAKRLLAEAGYPDGFGVDFACPNDRYINDEAVCQAVTGMWEKIGVRAKLRTMPVAVYFPMLQRFEASVYLIGWGVPTFDALYSLQSLLRSVGAGGDGNANRGRYSNPQMDALIERTRKEPDLKLRTELLTRALALQNQDVAHIPLYNQVIPWAMKQGIELVHRADNRLDWRLIKVN